MADSKKFYWLKLKRDFFKRHDIRIIEEMPNGKDFVLFYLKLLLESIDHEGSLRFSDTIPYNEQMLSVITNTNIDIVRSAMKLFIELRLIEIFDDQTIFMGEIEKMIGSESESAKRVREHRERKSLQCNADVTPVKRICNTEKEIDKDLDKDLEIDRENEGSFDQSTHSDFDSFSTDLSTDGGNRRTPLGGELGKGVVLLNQAQIDDLLEKLSLEEFNHYVSVVADCVLSGKPFRRKTHYQAILDMAAADRRIK